MTSVSKVITQFPAFISHILFSGHTWSRGHLQVNRTHFLFGKMKSQHKMTDMRTFRGLLRYKGWTRWILAYWDLIWDSLAPSAFRQTDILRERVTFLQIVCVCITNLFICNFILFYFLQPGLLLKNNIQIMFKIILKYHCSKLYLFIYLCIYLFSTITLQLFLLFVLMLWQYSVQIIMPVKHFNIESRKWERMRETKRT